ncbi:MAG: UDP-N-acetylmuramoyl-L-alanine--D-glutamate ligase [Gammaproteobacteria bacterium]
MVTNHATRTPGKLEMESDELEIVSRVLTGKSLVVGLGKTGLSFARFLYAHGHPFAIADSRELPPSIRWVRSEMPGLDLYLGRFDPELFAQFDHLLISPGVSVNDPAIRHARDKGIEVIGDVELFARHVDKPVIAITGSNGKSTVTALMGELVREAEFDVRVGGNIGTPVLELLDQHAPDYYVLELSSFQLETTHSLSPVASVILNVSPDHLDRYDDLDAYLKAKLNIFHGNGVIVVNRDETELQHRIPANRRAIEYGAGSPSGEGFGLEIRDGKTWIVKGEKRLVSESELKLRGKHNLSNAMAALALGEAIGLPVEKMVRAMKEFSGLPHRMQVVKQNNEVTWINDSKGTNVGATMAALDSVEGKVVLIAGGIGKGADFTPLAGLLNVKARKVILIGEDALIIGALINNENLVIHAGSMEDAVIQASRFALPGDTVLLSPACASFDMFSNFEERGAVFENAVKELTR